MIQSPRDWAHFMNSFTNVSMKKYAFFRINLGYGKPKLIWDEDSKHLLSIEDFYYVLKYRNNQKKNLLRKHKNHHTFLMSDIYSSWSILLIFYYEICCCNIDCDSTNVYCLLLCRQGKCVLLANLFERPISLSLLCSCSANTRDILLLK